MVAADEMDAMRIAQFEADKEGDCFDGEEATINIVTCKFVSSSKSLFAGYTRALCSEL